MAVVLSQLLRHSDNHGSSLKKSFFEKDDFSISDTYRRPNRSRSYDLQAASPDALPLIKPQETSGSQGMVQVTNYPGTYCKD